MEDSPGANPPGRGWRAEDYERGRPGWPEELVDGLFADLGLGPASTVVELGAGTGKLTRVLAPRARVVAVEPDPPMLEHLERRGDVEVLRGTAEAIPVKDATADAVFVAEAWHWFDEEAALREVRRVLRPGGGLVLTWNHPREEGQFELGPLRPLVEEAAAPRKRAYDRGGWREVVEREIGPLRLRTVDHEHAVDRRGYVAMVTSWSWVTALPDGERERLLGELSDLLPAELRLSYRAEAWWAVRRDDR